MKLRFRRNSGFFLKNVFQEPCFQLHSIGGGVNFSKCALIKCYLTKPRFV